MTDYVLTKTQREALQRLRRFRVAHGEFGVVPIRQDVSGGIAGGRRRPHFREHERPADSTSPRGMELDEAASGDAAL